MPQFLILSLAFFSLLFSKDLPEPYKSINVLPYDDHGWFSNDKPLQDLITLHNPQVVIEVGAWLGKSTRFIASSLSENAVVYAIDTWAGTTNEAVHMQDPRLPYLYQLFLSNTIHANLTDKIIPIRMKSEEAAIALNTKADLIYIDAGHDTESVYNDIIAWNQHLNEGGVLCGDDWSWKSVVKAVKKGAKTLNKQIRNSGNFWWYE